MTVTHKITNMELTGRGRPYQIHAKQGDTNTRVVEISLYANNTPFQPPNGTNFVVRFRKQDGTSGMYDTLPDGSTPAVTADGNVIVVSLAEQVLTCPGQVMCDVAMLSGLDVLGTFDFVIIVDKSPESGTDTSSQPYYKVTSLDALNATLDGKLNANQGSGNAGKFLGIGPDGAVAPVAATSADGKSAYAYAVESGYTGTEAEFSAKMAEEIPTELPNPHALTFTGAVTGSYDGSAPLSVEIPSGGGEDYSNVIRVLEEVSDYAITDIDPSEYSHFIISWSNAASGINFVSVCNGSSVGAALCSNVNGIAIILLDRSINNSIAIIRMQSSNISAIGGSAAFNKYGSSLSTGIHLTGTIPAGAVFHIRGWK